MTGLQIENISFNISGADILKNISCDLKVGEVVGLIGPNGAGKSSLIRAILGLVKINSGNVKWGGKSLSFVDLKARSHKIAYLAQGAPVHWPLSVEHIVGLGRIPHLNPMQTLGSDDVLAIDEALMRTDCMHLKNRIVTTLSGGERARVLLARVLASKSPFILADEPVASLDPAHQLKVMDILKNHAKDKGGVMVVMHDLNLALRYCDRLILLDDGNLIDQGTPDVILSDENLSNIFEIKASRWSQNEENFIVPHKGI